MGRTLGFFESFAFFRMGGRPWALVGSVVQHVFCVFQSDLSTPIRVSLIVVSDRCDITVMSHNTCQSISMWCNN